MSATINANDLKFTIFGAGHDYTLADSGEGEKVFFSHPFIPKGARAYAGQYLIYAPVYDDQDETVEPVITDVVKDDIAHCTFTPALGDTFDTVGEQTVKIHYRREYIYPESTILVEKELEQKITVVNHGTVADAYANNDVYTDGYCYIHPQDDTIGNNISWGLLGTFTKVSSFPWRTVSLASMGLSSSVTDITEFQYADTSKVTSLDELFNGLYNLPSLSGLETWDVSSVTTAKKLFEGCIALTDLKPLKSWSWKALTSSQRMFYNCAFEKLEGLEGWSFPVLTTNTDSMFEGCAKLKDLSALRNWDVSGIVSMTRWFNGCYSLTDLTPLSGWDVSGCQNLSYMFECWDKLSGGVPVIAKLRNFHGLENWDVSNVIDFSAMFQGRAWINDISALANWKFTKARFVVGLLTGTTPRNLTAVKDWEFPTVAPEWTLSPTVTGFYDLCGRSYLYHSDLLDKDLYWDDLQHVLWDYQGNTYTEQQAGNMYHHPQTLYPVLQNAGASSSWKMPWDYPDNHEWDVHGHTAEVFQNDRPDMAFWTNKPSWNS